MAVITTTSPLESPSQWVQEMVLVAFGQQGSGYEQMAASFVLALAFYISSVGLYVTILLAFLFTITFFIGALRVLLGLIS